MSQTRQPSAQVLRQVLRTDDPPAEPGHVLIYTRPVDGRNRTLARFSNGQIIIIL